MTNSNWLPLAALPLLAAWLLPACSEPATAPEAGADCVDEDRDGFGAEGHTACAGAEGVIDCDDTNPDVHPGAESEIGNGVDENCDGEDPARIYDCVDLDEDGYGRARGHDCPRSAQIDCDDANPRVNPGAQEIPDNDKDDDCAGGDAHVERVCTDTDDDGFGIDGASDCPGHRGQEDCDDSDPEINPNAHEIPGNEVDENCDGYRAALPEDCEDDDLDGYGTQAKHDCGERQEVDCDDRDPQMHPGAAERCNGRDDDCDGATDECETDGQVCHAERKVCVSALHGACEGNADCASGLRCTEAHECLGWTGSPCEGPQDCVENRCANNECGGVTCADLECAYSCNDELGCYDCDDSDWDHGCDLGVCAGYTCFEGDDLFHFVSDSDDLAVEAQLAAVLVDCARRKGWKEDDELADPFLCGGFMTAGLSGAVTGPSFDNWVCDHSADADFVGGSTDRDLAHDIVGCGPFDFDDLRFLGSLRADAFYLDCVWFDGDMVLGPCESYPAR